MYISISPDNLEAIGIQLNLINPTVVWVTYVSPNSDCNNLFNYPRNFNDVQDNLILLSDFNFPDIDWATLLGHSTASNQFCDVILQSQR